MGKQKYLNDVMALFAKSPVVSYSTISRIVRHRKKVKQYVKQLVHNLVTTGRIKKLAKGCYTSFDDSALAVFCFKPAYFGLQDALSYHNLWEQEAIPVIITPKKVRPGIRVVLGKNVIVRRTEKRYFFGITYSGQGKVAFPYSDVEKTFLDMIYFREKLSDELLAAFKERLNYKKLKAYLKRYPKRFSERVLSYL